MNIFDDGFDIEDAAYLGGAIGFAEESIRAENAKPDEDPEEDVDVYLPELKDTDLKLIRNMNPDLFNHIVSIVKRQKAKWRRDRMDYEEVSDELQALRETEAMMEGLGEEDDN